MQRLLLLGLLFIPTLVFAQEEASKLAPIAHLLDAQTCAVARVSLANIDAAAAIQYAANFTGAAVPPEELQASATKAKGFLATLREYGAEDLFVILSLADVPENAPPVVLTLKTGANEELIVEHLKQLRSEPLKKSERLKGTLVFSSPATLTRLRELKPVARPDLAAALANAGSAPVQFAAAIPADVQRVVRELLGKLPPEIGGGQGQDLLDALQWSSLAIEPPPKISLKWTIQSKNEAAAVSLRPRILAAINLAGQQAKLYETMPDFAEFAIRVTPAVKGNRLELNIAGDEVEAVLKQLKAGPLKLVSAAGEQAQSMNNLKQIALAMHNYHDQNSKLPAAASHSKDGKPLLSWRVHVLPYLEQDQLYKQFHLDEPWDSEHNLKLVARMPKTYLDPAHPQLAKEGKTVYAVPVGERSVFALKEGVSFARIVDGTSNTLLTVTLPADKAIVWTKPDDWNFVAKEPGAGLLDGKRNHFLCGYCDGSVRVLPADIDLADLRRLVQLDDGETLSKQY